MPNGPDYVVAYLGLARLDAITTGLNVRATEAERAKVIERAAPTLVLAEVPAGTGPPPAPPPAGDDLVETVVFTSGTTGVPKGAVFTSRQIRAITEMDTGGAWGHGGPAARGHTPAARRVHDEARRPPPGRVDDAPARALAGGPTR